MIMKNRRPQKTWGPVVIQPEGSTELKVRCMSGRFYCLFQVGNICTDQKPPKTIESIHETPDWCRHKEGALRDARAMSEKAD